MPKRTPKLNASAARRFRSRVAPFWPVTRGAYARSLYRKALAAVETGNAAAYPYAAHNVCLTVEKRALRIPVVPVRGWRDQLQRKLTQALRHYEIASNEELAELYVNEEPLARVSWKTLLATPPHSAAMTVETRPLGNDERISEALSDARPGDATPLIEAEIAQAHAAFTASLYDHLRDVHERKGIDALIETASTRALLEPLADRAMSNSSANALLKYVVSADAPGARDHIVHEVTQTIACALQPVCCTPCVKRKRCGMSLLDRIKTALGVCKCFKPFAARLQKLRSKCKRVVTTTTTTVVRDPGSCRPAPPCYERPCVCVGEGVEEATSQRADSLLHSEALYYAGQEQPAVQAPIDDSDGIQDGGSDVDGSAGESDDDDGIGGAYDDGDDEEMAVADDIENAAASEPRAVVVVNLMGGGQWVAVRGGNDDGTDEWVLQPNEARAVRVRELYYSRDSSDQWAAVPLLQKPADGTAQLALLADAGPQVVPLPDTSTAYFAPDADADATKAVTLRSSSNSAARSSLAPNRLTVLTAPGSSLVASGRLSRQVSEVRGDAEPALYVVRPDSEPGPKGKASLAVQRISLPSRASLVSPMCAPKGRCGTGCSKKDYEYLSSSAKSQSGSRVPSTSDDEDDNDGGSYRMTQPTRASSGSYRATQPMRASGGSYRTTQPMRVSSGPERASQRDLSDGDDDDDLAAYAQGSSSQVAPQTMRSSSGTVSGDSKPVFSRDISDDEGDDDEPADYAQGTTWAPSSQTATRSASSAAASTRFVSPVATTTRAAAPSSVWEEAPEPVPIDVATSRRSNMLTGTEREIIEALRRSKIPEMAERRDSRLSVVVPGDATQSDVTAQFLSDFTLMHSRDAPHGDCASVSRKRTFRLGDGKIVHGDHYYQCNAFDHHADGMDAPVRFIRVARMGVHS